jgi:hypothetical protein
MTIYDRDGMPIDMAALTVDELNSLLRESVDMLRRHLLPDGATPVAVKASLDRLDRSASQFTNDLYSNRKRRAS